MLKAVDFETKKRSKLKHLLVLLMRILAIASLVFAFAQPYFPTKSEEVTVGKKLISVYLDNSFSMNTESAEGDLFYLAKQRAVELANAFKPTDEFQLLTNDFEGKHQRFVSREEFIDLIKETSLSPKIRSIEEIYTKQKDLSKTAASVNNSFYWLSDFQQTLFNTESNFKVDSNALVNAIQFKGNESQNVYIDSVWFDSPIRKFDKEEALNVRVFNQSKENLQVRVELTINKQVRSFNNVIVEANSSASLVLSYKDRIEGLKEGKVTIGEYPNANVTHDDSFYFSYDLKKESKVLAINENSKFIDNTSGNLNQLFQTDDYFKLENVASSNINYANFNSYNLIVLNGLNTVSSGLQNELDKFVSSGGGLIIFPGEKVNLSNYNELLLRLNIGRFTGLDTANTVVNFINTNSSVYQSVFEKSPKNIDLPKVNTHYKLNAVTRAKVERLLGLRSGGEFLTKFTKGNGNIYLFSVSLVSNYSNLGSHSIFVPTILRIAETSGYAQSISHILGDQSIIIPDDNYQLEKITIASSDNKLSFIPEVQRSRGELAVYLSDEVAESGNYQIKYDNKLIGGFGLNYSRLESDLSTYPTDELKAKLDKIGAKLTTLSSSKDVLLSNLNTGVSKFWKWFIVLALVFLLFEIIIIRLLK